jgi:hypothetical protein
MPLYLISYDIAEKDAFEYGPLWAKLEELGAARILYSEWIVIGDSASDVYDLIAPLTQKKDRLLVQEMGSDTKWDKVMISDDDFQAWLTHARF